jgi:hypothetical protein
MSKKENKAKKVEQPSFKPMGFVVEMIRSEETGMKNIRVVSRTNMNTSDVVLHLEKYVEILKKQIVG